MDPAELVALIHACAGRRVLVVGDVMLDEYLWGAVRRISPEAPVPVVEIQRRSHVPGGAGNTAANVVGAGGAVDLVAVVGADAAAGQLREALAAQGVDPAQLLADEARPTTVKTRVLAQNQQIVRLDQELGGALTPAQEAALLTRVAELLPTADACILSDYQKGVLTPAVCQQVIAWARRQGKPVVTDPKGGDYAKYRGSTVIKPNTHELATALRRDCGDAAGLAAAGQALVDLLGDAAVLVTRGPDGMLLLRGGQEPLAIPAERRQVYDVTGAGDTVIAMLALALAAGAALEPAARLANRAAALVVARVGTSAVRRDELLATLQPHGTT